MRVARSERRRWCPIGQTHQPESDVECDWDHDFWEFQSGSAFKTNHRLRIRRMLVCSECEQGYFNQEDFDAHECYSAY